KANAGALIDVNIRMAKHPFHKNRNRRKPQGPLLQIGHINAGEKFCHIESAMTPIALAAAVIRVDLNFQIDVVRPYPSVDERLAAIVKRAGHAEFQWHRATSLSPRSTRRCGRISAGTIFEVCRLRAAEASIVPWIAWVQKEIDRGGIKVPQGSYDKISNFVRFVTFMVTSLSP